MARSRIFKNNTGTPWILVELGGFVVPAGSPGELDLTTLVSDPEVAEAVQNNGLTFDADHYLTVDGANNITDASKFWNFIVPYIPDFTDANHAHQNASGGGQLVGRLALSDFSASGGVDKVLGTDGSGDLSMGTGSIFTSRTTFADNEFITKAYADALKEGLDPKDACRVATTGALTATYSGTPNYTLTNNGAQAALSIDGIALAVGDRVLVKDQGGGTSTENGIYVVTDIGSPSTNWILTRANDFNNSADITHGAYTVVTEGGSNSGSGWYLTTNDPITLDTTVLTFALFSIAGVIVAGTGMTKSGTTLNVGSGVVEIRNGINFSANDLAFAPDDSTIELSGSGSGAVARLKDDGVTGAKLHPGVAGAGLAQDGSGNLDVQGDGTYIVVTGDQVTMDKVVTKGQKFGLQFTENGNVQDSYLSIGKVSGIQSGWRAKRNIKITGISIQLSASGTCTIELRKRDGAGGSVSVLNASAIAVSAAYGNNNVSLSDTLSAGEELMIYLSAASAVQNPVVDVEYELVA